MIEDPELQRLFEAESAEHLARLDDGLLRLEKTPAEPALLEEVFREAHSLKGAARMLGLGRIETTAHGLESLFNAARKGEAPLTPETIGRLNAALVDLRQRVREALYPGAERGTGKAERSDSGIPNAEGTNQPPPAPHSETVRPLSPAQPPPTAIDEQVRPAPADGRPAPSPRASLSIPSAEVPAATRPIPNAESPTPTPSEPFHIETVRVETRKLDDLLTQVGELSVIQGRAQHRLALMEELMERWAALARDRRQRRTVAPGGSEGEAAMRFGELLEKARDALFDDGARLESTVKLLEDHVRGIRLLPLSTVFALFPRMVRDLAIDQGKEAELALAGGDLTVDKRILEEMKDPLMHLIRNAIDHGIEPPAERERLGKPRSGMVRLSAAGENGNVLLEVQDDGRGLDLEVIRREAKKRGLHDDATLASMTPGQLQQLILMPGFSTSTYVTELSGRGVGLDVVRVNVERMKGDIRLQSTFGQGLAVQLRLPLRLSTTRILLASAGGRLYGLPVESVQTSRRVRDEQIFTLEGKAAFLLDGQPVMVARLADLLELPPGGKNGSGGGAGATPEPMACIVVQVGAERLGLLADDLLTEQEVVPKPLGAPLKRVRNVSALAMLGNGEICAVLNPSDLLRSAQREIRTAAAGRRSETAEAARPVVLLVEDSALIRAMEHRILVDAGYEVVTAMDGMDALNALGRRAFAAVVSDIVMPNMDGLALAARIRAEPRYQDLPVILVTSLASDDDKRRGLDAGANAYIPKPAFDQRVLVETLKRLIVT